MEFYDKKDIGAVFVQLSVSDDKLTNLKRAERLIREACDKFKPRLVVLPEYFNTKLFKDDIERHAETFPTGDTYRTLEKLAKELDIYLVGGSIPERADDDKRTIFNTTLVFAPTGKLIARYRKIHLLDVDERRTDKTDEWKKLRETDFIRAGKELTTFELDGIKCGLGLGYDLCFDELTRLYRKKDVEMMIFPSFFTEKLGRMKFELLAKARAVDNQMFVLAVTQAMDDRKFDRKDDRKDYRKDDRKDDRTDDCRDDRKDDRRDDEFEKYGRSLLVDFRGRVLARGGYDEELIYAKLDFKDLDFYRKKYDMLKERRTDIYDTVYKY